MTVRTDLCLANLAQASAQDVFDTSAHHLLTQGRKSMREMRTPGGEDIFGCAYRDQDGCGKCAAGIFIADDE